MAAGAKVAVERAVKELQEMRREAASPIIIPDRVPPGLGGPGGPRGSGNIQLPSAFLVRRESDLRVVPGGGVAGGSRGV